MKTVLTDPGSLASAGVCRQLLTRRFAARLGAWPLAWPSRQARRAEGVLLESLEKLSQEPRAVAVACRRKVPHAGPWPRGRLPPARGQALRPTSCCGLALAERRGRSHRGG